MATSIVYFSPCCVLAELSTYLRLSLFANDNPCLYEINVDLFSVCSLIVVTFSSRISTLVPTSTTGVSGQ